ncbi:MAG TPA: MFS transporter [Tepidisphaeraceae bacterium]|nr:MFS transporter [Tepidisphaeraceae bacterium]
MTSIPTVLPVIPEESSEVARRYRYWRFRILATTMVGYAIYYFVRTNISVALKPMGDDLGFSKERLGIILTAGGMTYGVSKFVNGFLGDRANPRYFMAIGLLVSALMNVFFGLSSSLLFLAGFWLMNNWAQGMGFPPCAKSMAYWFSPKERNQTFGIWHVSHMIGAALVGVLTAYLIAYGLTHVALLLDNLGITGAAAYLRSDPVPRWQLCFFVPAGMAVITTLFILLFLRDTPETMGLPPVEVYKGEETPRQLAEEIKIEEPYRAVVIRYVFLNPFMWVISVANLLVYTLRYTSLHWGPTYLQEMKGFSVLASGWLTFGSEMAGLVSALIAGFVADRVFRGRAGRVCVIAMVLMALAVWTFWITPGRMKWATGSLFVVMGFMVYVPQMLIAAMAMNLGTKRAAAAAVGLTGIFGYASSIVSGWGLGRVVDKSGWDGAFILMIGCAIGTLVLMAFTWNVGAHTHGTESPRGFPIDDAKSPEAAIAK